MPRKPDTGGKLVVSWLARSKKSMRPPLTPATLPAPRYAEPMKIASPRKLTTPSEPASAELPPSE